MVIFHSYVSLPEGTLYYFQVFFFTSSNSGFHGWVVRFCGTREHVSTLLGGAVHQLQHELHPNFVPCGSVAPLLLQLKATWHFDRALKPWLGWLGWSQDECPMVAPSPNFPCIFNCVTPEEHLGARGKVSVYVKHNLGAVARLEGVCGVQPWQRSTRLERQDLWAMWSTRLGRQLPVIEEFSLEVWFPTFVCAKNFGAVLHWRIFQLTTWYYLFSWNRKPEPFVAAQFVGKCDLARLSCPLWLVQSPWEMHLPLLPGGENWRKVVGTASPEPSAEPASKARLAGSEDGSLGYVWLQCRFFLRKPL